MVRVTMTVIVAIAAYLLMHVRMVMVMMTAICEEASVQVMMTMKLMRVRMLVCELESARAKAIVHEQELPVVNAKEMAVEETQESVKAHYWCCSFPNTHNISGETSNNINLGYLLDRIQSPTSNHQTSSLVIVEPASMASFSSFSK